MLESIKCSTSGAYYLRGQWVPADAQAPAALAAAGVTAEQAGQAYKGTMAYGILTAHNTSGSDRDLRIKFDAMASHDITFVGIIQTARASGLEKFPIPYVLTNCHNSLCAVGGTINEDDHRFGLSAAKKYGGIFVPAPSWRSSTSTCARRFAGCGKMILGSDSHTRYGALGTMAIGEGGGELAKQLLGRTYDVARPGVVAVCLTGALPAGVRPPRCGHCTGGRAVQERLCQEQGHGVCGPRHCLPAAGYPQRHRCHDHRDHLPFFHLGDR